MAEKSAPQRSEWSIWSLFSLVGNLLVWQTIALQPVIGAWRRHGRIIRFAGVILYARVQIALVNREVGGHADL